jgi:uncharacterized RDD family membrane protein YckC
MSSGPEPGYYADPSIPGYIRYWNGTEWVAGTSRPAPGQEEQDPAGSSGLGGAHTSGTAQSAADQARSGQTSTGRHAGGQSRAEDRSPAQSSAQLPAQSSAQLSAQSSAQLPQLDDSSAWRPSAGPSGAQPQQNDALGSSAADVWTAELAADQPSRSAAAQQRSAPPRYDVDPLSQSLPAQSLHQQPRPPQQFLQQPAAPAMPDRQAMPAVQPWQPQTQQPPQPQPAPVAQPTEKKRHPDPVYPEPEPISVATMVVPSAFGNRGAYGAGWAGAPGATGAVPKYDPSPFAADLPGAPADPDEPRIQDSEPEVIVVELASPGSRILARIIDVAIAAAFTLPVTLTLGIMAHSADHNYVQQLRVHATTTYKTLGVNASGFALWGAAIAVLLVTVIGTDAILTARRGQTIGGRLLGIQVVGAGDAREIGSAKALTRELTFWLFGLLPLIDILALGGALWGRPYHQGWHEKASRTMTINI